MWSHEHNSTYPADILVLDEDKGRHSTFDVSITSPLSAAILPEASISMAAAAMVAELRKHRANDF